MRRAVPTTGGRSVARVWDEALLDAVRRDVPAPTTHARNLFHLSVAMWDAWAAYDPIAEGVLVREDRSADDVAAARDEAISYAAYRLLLWRGTRATGMQATFDEYAATMAALCYRTDVVTTEGDAPAALGNRIAAAVIAWGEDDGSNEALDYQDPARREANPPLVVGQPGAPARDPDRWQPLSLSVAIAQNGLPIPGGVQRFIGATWGGVRSFALPPSVDGLAIDPGPPPALADPATRERLRRDVLAVIAADAALDPSDGVRIRVDPGALGDNPLGTDDGRGHDRNPVTGEPYVPEVVPRGDYLRALVEYWADGPRSETPPGHWNVVANAASDAMPALRIAGAGSDVDRLEWDVKLYLALNGALHDAAIAAWGVKAVYDTSRPITLVRWMAQHGQSSDPSLPSYDPLGLPLAPGIVRLGPDGRVEVRAWVRGDDPDLPGRVRWIDATTWAPYQAPTFVTPSFPGYVSGHSTFSRAAAEVLASFTGSPYFPGGFVATEVAPGTLRTDVGPTETVTLQWATYFDAADAAGRSRIFGGIHVPSDDYAGRRLGATCGRDAWELASAYFVGAA
ncbi:MAG: vanadium-dependent haloperoxidase [Actinomycetota bacterium]